VCLIYAVYKHLHYAGFALWLLQHGAYYFLVMPSCVAMTCSYCSSCTTIVVVTITEFGELSCVLSHIYVSTVKLFLTVSGHTLPMWL